MNKYLLSLLNLTVACSLAMNLSAHEEPDHEDEHHSLDSDQHHGQHAHVHGEVVFTLAQDGNTILIELDSPAFNLTGFEHEPKDNRERAIANATAYQLKQLKSLLALPEQAGCKLQSVEVDSILLDDDHEGHSHEYDEDSDFVPHADFTASYQLHCQAPEQITELEVKLFKAFQAIEKVKFEWILGSHQGAAEATPDNPTITIQ